MQHQFCVIDDMSDARGVISMVEGVARSSDEYTLLILRISNIDNVGGGLVATHKCNNAI